MFRKAAGLIAYPFEVLNRTLLWQKTLPLVLS
jgi:hypothetical protein